MMKRIFCIFCLCLILLGCSSENGISEKTTMEQMYYFSRQAGMVYKTNLMTGNTSTVCSDPLCTHGEDCLFTDVAYITAHENTLYFSRSGNITRKNKDGEAYITESICSYDYESGKSRILCEFRSERDSSLQGMIEYHEGYVYFYRTTPDPDVSEFSLYRVPADGGEAEALGLSVPMWHGAHYRDRLYFYDGIGTLYSTDIYGNHRIDEIVLETPGRISYSKDVSGGYLYAVLMTEFSNRIWRKHLDSGMQEMLYETHDGTVASMTPVGEKVYFLLMGEDIPYGKTADGRELTDCYGGKIYVMDAGRKKCRTVYDNDETHMVALRKAGESIVVLTERFEEDRRVEELFVLTD